MEKIYGFWENGFYTEVVLIIVLILALTIAFSNRKRIPGTKLFPFYFSSFLLLFLIEYVYHIYYPSDVKFLLSLDNAMNLVVTVLECLAFLFFLYQNLTTRIVRNIIIIIAIPTSLLLLLLFTNYLNLKTLHRLYLYESLMILSLCVVYFVELLKSKPKSKISESPSFWVVSGLVIYFLGTLPTTLITDYVYNLDYLLYANAYSIINLFYILLYLLIIKAYKCTSKKATYSDF